MKITFITNLLFAVCIHVFAQDKYDEGSIILKNGEVVNGYILNEIDASLAFDLHFKENNGNSESTTLSPSEIVGFSFNNGRSFDRLVVKTEVENDPDAKLVFAKKIITGKVDLWIWRKKKSKSEFVIQPKGEIGKIYLPSPKKINITKPNGKTYVKNDTKYLYLLKYILGDSINLNNLKYTEKQIKRRITDYNKYYETEYPLNSYVEETISSFEILLGASFYNSSEFQSYRIGIFYTKQFSERNRRVSISRGITYIDLVDKKIKSTPSQSGSNRYRTQAINIVPLGFNFHSRYKLFQPYAFVGLGIAALKYSDYVYEDFAIVDDRRRYLVLPAPTIRVGTKINFGSNAIIIELIPISIDPSNISVGFSF